jgi:hypothetical protein
MIEGELLVDLEKTFKEEILFVDAEKSIFLTQHCTHTSKQSMMDANLKEPKKQVQLLLSNANQKSRTNF